MKPRILRTDRVWHTSAVHRLTVLVYPDGGVSLSVVSRDPASLDAVASRVLGVDGPTFVEGVYHLTSNGWVWERELRKDAPKPKHQPLPKPTADVSGAALATLAAGPLRSGALIGAIVGSGISRSTAMRGLRFLVRTGVIERRIAAPQHIEYAILRGKKAPFGK